MNIFNRIITILLLVVLFFAIPGVVIFPGLAADLIITTVESAEASLVALREAQPWILYGVALGVNLLLAALIFFETRPRPAKNEGRIRMVSGGNAVVGFDLVRSRLTDAVRGVPGILSVETNVQAKRRRLQADYNVMLAPSANAGEIQGRIEAITQAILEEQMGLRAAGKPNVTLRIEGQAPAPTPEQPPTSRPQPQSPQPPPSTPPRQQPPPQSSPGSPGLSEGDETPRVPAPPFRPPGGFVLPKSDGEEEKDDDKG